MSSDPIPIIGVSKEGKEKKFPQPDAQLTSSQMAGN